MATLQRILADRDVRCTFDRGTGYRYPHDPQWTRAKDVRDTPYKSYDCIVVTDPNPGSPETRPLDAWLTEFDRRCQADVGNSNRFRRDPAFTRRARDLLAHGYNPSDCVDVGETEQASPEIVVVEPGQSAVEVSPFDSEFIDEDLFAEEPLVDEDEDEEDEDEDEDEE